MVYIVQSDRCNIQPLHVIVSLVVAVNPTLCHHHTNGELASGTILTHELPNTWNAALYGAVCGVATQTIILPVPTAVHCVVVICNIVVLIFQSK